MALGDVAGVFSRYFIVGFFLPAFFALAVLAFGLSSEALPNEFEAYSDGAKIAIVGGSAILLGLSLLALNYQVLRLFEGYPLVRRGGSRLVKPLHDRLIEREHARYDALVARSQAQGPDADEAAWLLDRYFSEDSDKRLLPTAFGNAVRAFERHSRIRWGLNGIGAWPRIEMLLDEHQRISETDARGNVAFLINTCLLAAAVGLALVVDLIVNETMPWYLAWLFAVLFAIAYAAYRAAVGAAVIWGSSVRAAIDLKRLELYKAFGVRAPTDFEDERLRIAPAINRCLLYAEPLDKDIWGAPEDSDDEEENE